MRPRWPWEPYELAEGGRAARPGILCWLWFRRAELRAWKARAWSELRWYLAWVRAIGILVLIAAGMIGVAWLLYDLATGHGCIEVVRQGGHVIRRLSCKGWF